jgi:putative hydrolase of the HAD superfamily
MSPERIEGVCLDVDGTLYSIRRMVWTHLWTVLPLRRFFRVLHRVRDGMRLEAPFDDFRAEQARRLGRALDVPDYQAAAWVREVVERRWMSVFQSTSARPGTRAALERLAARGLRLAVLSDYPLGIKLEGLGLADIPWRARINAEDTGALKPHPAPFRAVLAALELPPERVLHIGDLESTDVSGALGMGLRAARLLTRRAEPTTRAGLAFRDFSELVPRLLELGWL